MPAKIRTFHKDTEEDIKIGEVAPSVYAEAFLFRKTVSEFLDSLLKE